MKLSARFVLRSLSVGLLLVPALAAQDLQQKYEDKLALEFVEFGGWVTDYDAARAQAKAEGKVLFVYFSRSYSP